MNKEKLQEILKDLKERNGLADKQSFIKLLEALLDEEDRGLEPWRNAPSTSDYRLS